MITVAHRMVSRLKVSGTWQLRVLIAFVGLYFLVAYVVQRMQGGLGRGWLDNTWGLAYGAVMAGALTGCLSCLRELHTLKKRVAPAAHAHASVQRMFRNLMTACFTGLGLLVLISHMKVQLPEVQSSPWVPAAFVWIGAPLYMLSAMAWHRAWHWWIKAPIWLLAAAHCAAHKVVALSWGVYQGAWLTWALFGVGAAGLLWVSQLLLAMWGTSWSPVSPFWTQALCWLKRWLKRPPLLQPRMMAGVLPLVASQSLVRIVNHPDFPDSLVSNYFWSLRVIFLVTLMFAMLRSERTHWRWQMVPGSGFRKQLGTDIYKSTAQYWAVDVTIGLMLFAVLRWFWAPYPLADVIDMIHLLAWPLMVDVACALACAVWLLSMRWRFSAGVSVLDMSVLLSLLLVLWLAMNPRMWGARSWQQDALMLSVTWLWVLRANQNFETSNWSWLNDGRYVSWMPKTKRT